MKRKKFRQHMSSSGSTAEQVVSVTDSDRFDAAACHEAGHAVMRWLVGLPATKLTITFDENSTL